MTVLDLIKKSAIMLNIQEVLNADLTSVDNQNQQTLMDNNFALKRLYEFAKIVLNEINSYMPTVKQIKCTAKNKQISLNSFEGLSKIIGVQNHYGYVKYSVEGENIIVAEDGNYLVTFNQCPQINSLLDVINQHEDILGDDILVYGLNSYYCLATGLFNEFNVYNAHYSERLAKLKNFKVFAMPCRSWE
jgi:hypothetical protein